MKRVPISDLKNGDVVEIQAWVGHLVSEPTAEDGLVTIQIQCGRYLRTWTCEASTCTIVKFDDHERETYFDVYRSRLEIHQPST